MKMDYMKRLQAYQEENGLNTADMAREFGVEWQIYKNWINRDSLPKKYYEKAVLLIGGSAESAEIREIRAKLEALSPRGLEAALKSIDAIYDLEQKS